jgi:diaminopimelate epimerase
VTDKLLLTTIGGRACADVNDSDFNCKIVLTLPDVNLERPFETHVNGQLVQVHKIDMGNPHAVVWIADHSAFDFVESSREILQQKDELGLPIFPDGANVAFVTVLDRKTVVSRVVERGVGRTLACGSSACATIVSGCALDILDPAGVQVCFELGRLQLRLTANHVEFSGRASFVYEGTAVV